MNTRRSFFARLGMAVAAMFVPLPAKADPEPILITGSDALSTGRSIKVWAVLMPTDSGWYYYRYLDGQLEEKVKLSDKQLKPFFKRINQNHT